MAVKPITNRQAVISQTTNRAQQRSLKNRKISNRAQSVNPGLDFSKGFSISLRDIDESIIAHIKNIMKPTIRESGEVINVPVLYGNEERWKSVRKNGVLRDKNGIIILPIMIIRRTDITMNDDMPLSFDHDIKGEFIHVARAKQWSKVNRYDRFAVQSGKNPAYETFATGMPDFVICTYSIILLTNYMEQMNGLNDLWIRHSGTYFGNSTNYKFLTTVDGGISDATEMSAEGERLIRNELSLTVKGYMLPEFTESVFGKIAEMTKQLSPSRVVFGTELELQTAVGSGGTGASGIATQTQGRGTGRGSTPTGAVTTIGTPVITTTPEGSQ